MSSVISANLRQLVFDRANGRCEYCLFPQSASLHKHEPDHIVPRQHGGQTETNNLALSCFRCNRYKGPNVGSFDPETGQLVAFFNPRTQSWDDHFVLEGARIQPLTAAARVTVKILRLNDELRLEERGLLVKSGLFALK